MERVNNIRNHEMFQMACRKLQEFERNRIYCCHGMDHSMDVARICYIMSLEKGCQIPKDLIYGAALLHDLGRIYEYQNQCSHVSGSILLALQILPESGFSKEETDRIISVIQAHRKTDSSDDFERLFYHADKLSRRCFDCDAKDSCKWSKEKMNEIITY